MARITRRRVLGTAAAATAALGLPIGARGATWARNKIIVLSDVHIGDNSPTVWYQQKYHEPYLSALLDHVIARADEIAELVILGDFVDFWTYPPDRRPPRLAEIAAANTGIFGPNGKLTAAANALRGRVSYVPGNHDMSITQADLDALPIDPGYRIRLHTEENYFPGSANGKLLMAHGNRWTMFNAPDLTTRLAPLPIGHFATRSFCHMLMRKLKPGQTVADLADQGQPNGIDFGSLLSSVNGSLTETAVNYASRSMDLPMDAPIILPSGDTVTLAEVKQIYSGLFTRWEATAGGGRDGEMEAGKMAIADLDNGTYLPWFAQRAALQNDADMVVFGHTHQPVRGVKDGFTGYLNTGFDCASMPDMPKRHFTFVEFDVGAMQGQIMQVRHDYAITPLDNAKQDSISPGATFDYSTYVTIDNSAGGSDLVLADTYAVQGHYVVRPPAQVPRGKTARFWIQDYPGGAGSKGSATYRNANSSVTLNFACPTGVSPNLASGAAFRGKSGSDADYGPVNAVPKFGHPFFVQFMT